MAEKIMLMRCQAAQNKITSLSFLQCVDFPIGDCEWKSNTRITMTTRKRRITSAQILQEIRNNSDSDIADAESISFLSRKVSKVIL